jgi:hypothetical protein
MANGAAGPVRIISGQKAKLVRYSHGVTYDPAHDEIFASEPQTSAILAFRGGAEGEEAPLRVIQGAKSNLHSPFQMAVDLQHDELLVADAVLDGVLTFRRDANGDVAPVRMIAGKRVRLFHTSGVAVDTERNLMVVAFASNRSGKHEHGGIHIFNRTDNGNVAPRATIAGPHTGIYSAWHVAVYAGHIFATIGNLMYKPAYDLGGFSCRSGVTRPPPWVWNHPPGFIGVWRETDNGDVPPRAIIGGGDSGVYGPTGLAIDPKDGEISVTDQRNQIYTFLVPQLFAPTF